METIEQEKKAVKKLKNYLILLMRVLAILFIVFAFAQPYTGSLGDSNTGNNRLISMYIDNSNSMSAKGSNGELSLKQKPMQKRLFSNSLQIKSLLSYQMS